MKDKNNSEELEWNLSGARTDLIAELTVNVRSSFRKASNHTTKGRVDRYLTSLETLFMDIRCYIKDEEFEEMVDEQLQGFHSELDTDNAEKVFRDAKELDTRLQQKRQDLGLDIQSSEKPDPENAAIQGLGGK
jgi:hypothetical protein